MVVFEEGRDEDREGACINNVKCRSSIVMLNAEVFARYLFFTGRECSGRLGKGE